MGKRRKRYAPEQIVAKLRQIEVELAKGQSVRAASLPSRRPGAFDPTLRAQNAGR